MWMEVIDLFLWPGLGDPASRPRSRVTALLTCTPPAKIDSHVIRKRTSENEMDCHNNFEVELRARKFFKLIIVLPRVS